MSLHFFFQPNVILDSQRTELTLHLRQHTSIYNLRLHVLSMPMNNHLSSPIITILNNDLLSAYILFLCSGVVKVAITVVLNIIDILF